MHSTLKSALPDPILRWLYEAGLKRTYTPGIDKIRSGDFLRTRPFCSSFGYTRGGPVDRYYIENFLEKESETIQGRVLEIGGRDYTEKYGGANVSQSDILHIDESNPKATFVGDLSDGENLPVNAFDCLVITQTLHLIYDMPGALRTCHRILRPGGTLLVTVPGISPVDKGEWRDTWYWSLTTHSLKRMLREVFGGEEVDVESYGNAYAAAAFLYGMGQPEVPERILNVTDPSYQVTISGKAVKRG